MEQIFYLAGVSNIMSRTNNASVKRCSKIWKNIQKERAEKIFCDPVNDWNSPERKQLEYELEIKFIREYYGINLD